MDIANLLHSLTVAGLTLTQEADGLKVLGPVHRLTPEQKQALTEHKQTLLTLATCYFQTEEQEERDAIEWADSQGPDVRGSLADAIEFFEELTDTMRQHNPPLSIPFRWSTRRKKRPANAVALAWPTWQSFTEAKAYAATVPNADAFATSQVGTTQR